MISIEQINGEIAVLEEQIPTHVVMQKLAALYTVRDHMGIQTNEAPVSVVTVETIPAYGMSEYLQTVEGKDLHDVMLQMDELMSTLQILNPKLYAGVMRKLVDNNS